MLDVARNTGRNMGEEGGGRRPADVWMLLATSKQHCSLDFTIRQLMADHLKIRRLRTRPMASDRNGRPSASSSVNFMLAAMYRHMPGNREERGPKHKSWPLASNLLSRFIIGDGEGGNEIYRESQ
jgi:hypothetical protein